MKLLLCSEGFYTPNTVQECVKLCCKPQNQIGVAVINEAYAADPGDKRWVLDNLNDAAKNFTAGFSLVNLLALPIDEVERRIMEQDFIFVIGGNTDYLMHVFIKTGFDKLLPKLLETKVYVGSSAGSQVVGRRVSDEAYLKIYGEHNDYGTTDYLGLVDLAIKPHMYSKHFPNNRPEVLEEVAGGTNFPVYGLQDDSAIVINGRKQYFIGSEAYQV
ncbi:MAG TPA: Type 1 glutamine amidotransferase-like domain-containing protein [Candidatus Saccharimonadales bacterium]|nr:Type 1 glutamine amidotransferase-like domain-containing protein [Candidatus Saccharimonadales bacterium]